MAAPGPSPARRGYPPGAWLVIAVETCERFSFYGMLAILVLFLTAGQDRGGFHWPDADALGLLGIYSGLMYALPAVGGWLADHVWGNRRAVTMGASLMTLGHFLMAVPAAVPGLVHRATGVPVERPLAALDLPLGRLLPPAGLDAAIEAAAGPADAGAVRLAYRLTGIAFFTALAFLVLGNALMKSTLVVLVGDLFPEGDPRRDGAYAYYYLGISVGAFASGVVVGFVAERFGWHWGFTVAGILMTVALTLYLTLGPRLLGDVGRLPKAKLARAPQVARPVGDRAGLRLGVLFVLALVLLAFEIGWYQLYGTWSLFIDRSIDRTVAGFQIPVPWFPAFNALMVILVTPYVASLLVRMESRGRHVDIVLKYVAALALVGAGQAVLAGAAGGRAGWAVAGVAVSLLSLGELVAWPSTYGIVYRLAPPALAAAAMGGWYLLTLGSGGYLAGLAGQLTDRMTPAARFGAFALFSGAAAVGALLLRPALRRIAARAGAPL
jgi:POT family proton-dependent oligopeptide transporter